MDNWIISYGILIGAPCCSLMSKPENILGKIKYLIGKIIKNYLLNSGSRYI